jgi:hypothetical protein
MTRFPARFRWMAWPALLAAVLLAAMPTAGRVLAATMPSRVPVLMEMCTALGRQLVDVSPFIASEEDPAPPAADGMEACGYCVLPVPVPPVPPRPCLATLPPAGPAPARNDAAPVRAPRNLHGLGAQAPPLFRSQAS